ncbi:hypothetical protein FE257_002558 [Aspergillus nanangensis]|uniref:Uncharacterized protein n=1 Tax=Aspergillus nanangensis TaxID=2582783 RepID=A0AAD4GWQ5_ASPNN|nr:hypothetical protein FE257_002558 [Aspergillus nanangensis]
MTFPSPNPTLDKTTPAPPPPPLPSTTSGSISNTEKALHPPTVTQTGPLGALMVELLIYNGHPFKDHWAYWVCSRTSSHHGVKIHATGDVRNGFKFEVKRSLDLRTREETPTKRVPLQWVDGQYFDEKSMFNGGQYTIDDVPVCRFESSAYKIGAPGKSLNTTGDRIVEGTVGKRVIQRDCQTWIVESAEQLAMDGIFSVKSVDYLRTIRQ